MAEESRRERLARKLEGQAKADAKRSVTKALTARAHKRPDTKETREVKYRHTRSQRAVEMLSAYLDQAAQNVAKSLMEGDMTTSRWLLDKVAADEGTVLPRSIDAGDLSDPVKTAEGIVNNVLHGRISIEAGMKLIALVEKQAGLTAASEIADLKELAERLTGEAAKTIDGRSHELQPAWLKLKADAPETKPTHPGNKTPAE